jgi:hypothetical protein
MGRRLPGGLDGIGVEIDGSSSPGTECFECVDEGPVMDPEQSVAINRVCGQRHRGERGLLDACDDSPDPIRALRV